MTHKLLLEMKILCRHINVHYFNFSFPQSYFFFIKNFFFISRKCNCLKQNVQSLILKWKIYTAVINYRVDELRHEELLIGDLMRNCRPTHTQVESLPLKCGRHWSVIMPLLATTSTSERVRVI